MVGDLFEYASFSPDRLLRITDRLQGSDGLFGFFFDSIKDKTMPRDNELAQPTPALIPGLADIKELSCGANHVLALTHSGNVYAWGSGEQSELGRRLIHRRRFHALIPYRVGLPKNTIKQIYAGFHHNFAIDNSGKVYTWGLNNFGQAGLPASDEELTVPSPTIVKSLEPFRIRHIAGGSHHSIACTEDGQVLAWGRCDDFQMGMSIDDIPHDHLTFDSAQRPRILNVPTVVPGIFAAYRLSKLSLTISQASRI
jgi:regulator of chromosome condensation